MFSSHNGKRVKEGTMDDVDFTYGWTEAMELEDLTEATTMADLYDQLQEVPIS